MIAYIVSYTGEAVKKIIEITVANFNVSCSRYTEMLNFEL